MTLSLPDLTATQALGRRIARLLRPGDAVLLEGPLGAGKSELARALLRAAARDPALEVPSPSFTLVQSYETPAGLVHHYDLWRLERARDVLELDWDGARDDIVLVEWPDRLGPLRPEHGLTVVLAIGHGEERIATLAGWPDRIGHLAGTDSLT
ncbi:MAG TPA: tRNA (adenosine(37)-N6)-threonylcarbamoyltransferase complex ATPase subunit type 1 TsaE [Rhodopila sp.]|nr:tRNA (adenosine(37)-N6)-threonylcarbamoyltransferase complex ATPase subunit type 1 TsaE [Rhodopila sp.]HVZ08701.1 tRNA (adenosine(37)-N6)-threonylcarbamoyltransferase complex ATPase subunit type 1 TsaE [Rhodopila sp.]